MPQPKKTALELIQAFELQVSDVTELSSTEELSLLNSVYQRICADRPWEFLKISVSGSLAGSGDGGIYITVPDNFGFFYENAQYTDNNAQDYSVSSPRVIYLGTNLNPYQVINYGDRRQYKGKIGYCYYDIGAGKIYFTGTPTETTYSMDYIKIPALLLSGDYPIFSGQFHDIIIFAMATDNSIMQLSPKATSYAVENNAKFKDGLLQMQYFYSQFQQA
jgi:hypothetical protein